MDEECEGHTVISCMKVWGWNGPDLGPGKAFRARMVTRDVKVYRKWWQLWKPRYTIEQFAYYPVTPETITNEAPPKERPKDADRRG